MAFSRSAAADVEPAGGTAGVPSPRRHLKRKIANRVPTHMVQPLLLTPGRRVDPMRASYHFKIGRTWIRRRVVLDWPPVANQMELLLG